MPRRTYSPHSSSVTTGTIDHTTLLAVGRLVRACAELGDIVLLPLRHFPASRSRGADVASRHH